MLPIYSNKDNESEDEYVENITRQIDRDYISEMLTHFQSSVIEDRLWKSISENEIHEMNTRKISNSAFE